MSYKKAQGLYMDYYYYYRYYNNSRSYSDKDIRYQQPNDIIYLSTLQYEFFPLSDTIRV